MSAPLLYFHGPDEELGDVATGSWHGVSRPWVDPMRFYPNDIHGSGHSVTRAIRSSLSDKSKYLLSPTKLLAIDFQDTKTFKFLIPPSLNLIFKNIAREFSILLSVKQR